MKNKFIQYEHQPQRVKDKGGTKYILYKQIDTPFVSNTIAISKDIKYVIRKPHVWKQNQTKINFNKKKYKHSNNNINENKMINNNNWKSIALFKMILGSSRLDEGTTNLFIHSDNTLEYTGQNPAGNLIMTYFSFNLINLRRKELVFETQVNTSIALPDIIFSEKSLSNKYFIGNCIKAYFKYYSHFCPVVDEYLFYKKPHPLVEKAIVSIGFRYLPNSTYNERMNLILDEIAVNEFKKHFFKPSVEVVMVYVILSQYQSAISEFKKLWMYQSTCTHMCKLLGLNVASPKHLKLNKRQIRNRCNQWWACCIQDGVFSFIINRPHSLRQGAWELPYPELGSLPTLSSTPITHQIDEVIQRASYIYWKGKVLLCEHLLSIDYLRKTRFEMNQTYLLKTLIKVLSKLEKYNSSHYENMQKIWKNQPLWVFKICDNFLLYHIIFYNNSIIEACNLYLKVPNVKQVSKVNQRSLVASIAVILAAEKLGVNFYKYGIVYRFYCLTNAIMAHIKNLYQHEQSNEGGNGLTEDINNIASEFNIDPKYYIKKGLFILSSSIPYFPIAQEFLNTIDTLLKGTI